MRCAWGLVLVAGCNWIYHIDDTSQAPPIDADLFSCDPIPTFTVGPTHVTNDVLHYSTDAAGGLAIASCTGTVCQGAVGGPTLQPSQFTDSVQTEHSLPRLSPAGDELFVLTKSAVSSGAVTTYSLTASSTWEVQDTIVFLDPMLAMTVTGYSQPTVGGHLRHMMFVSGGMFLELVQDQPGTFAPVSWIPVTNQQSSYTPTDWSLSALAEPTMSADGLRLVFRGTSTSGHDDVYIATRASLADSFSAPTLLYATSDDQTELTPFMTPDCGRLYFTLDSDLFYVTY